MSGTTRRQLLFSGITAFAGLAAAVIDLAGLVGASPFWSGSRTELASSAVPCGANGATGIVPPSQ